MRKLYLCGTSWCKHCKHVNDTLVKEVETECPGQTEYIDVQYNTDAIDRFKVYKIPMLILTEDEHIVCELGDITAGQIIRYLKGETDDPY